jgi:predicted metal-dependent peptidase
VLGEIVAELRAFRETFPCRLTVIQADAAIQQVQEWSEFDGTELPATMPILGRGGTDFRPVFDWLAQQHDAATVVLYATDGMGSFPSRPPPWPVIWLLTPDAVRLSELPFGVGVRMAESLAESLAESFAESLSFASAEDPEG